MISTIPMSEIRMSAYQIKKHRRQLILRILSVIVRIVLIALTVNFLSIVFFDDDAIKIKPYLITLLFIMLYGQCALLSMRGLDWLVLRKPTRRMLTGASLLICAPLYFVVLVFSLIPIEVPAVFFITIFPIIALNALPMESIIDEFRLMGYPKLLFWFIQLAMQLAIVGVVQSIMRLLFL